MLITKYKIWQLKKWLKEKRSHGTKCVEGWEKYLTEIDNSPKMQKQIAKEAELIKFRVNKVIELRMLGYNV